MSPPSLVAGTPADVEGSLEAAILLAELAGCVSVKQPGTELGGACQGFRIDLNTW